MNRSPRPQPLSRFVYVIGPQQGLQKVGLATDPQTRLAALQTASPFDLHIHVAVQVPFSEAHTIERQARRLLARSRVRSEWFQTSPGEAIAAVHSAAGPARGAYDKNDGSLAATALRLPRPWPYGFACDVRALASGEHVSAR